MECLRIRLNIYMANLNKPGSGKELLKQIKMHSALNTRTLTAGQQLSAYKTKLQFTKPKK